MSLRSKLFAAIGLTLCVVLGVLVTLTLMREHQRQNRLELFHGTTFQMAAAVASKVHPQFVLESGLFYPDETLIEGVRSVLLFRVEDDGAVDVQAWGAAVDDDRARTTAFELHELALETDAAVHDEAGNFVAVATTAGRADLAQFVVAVELEPIGSGAEDTGRFIFVVIAVALVVLLLYTWFVLDRFVARPLRQVASGAERVASGDYSALVEVRHGDDEIRQVVDAFNSMMVELSALRATLQERIGEAVRKARRTQDSLVIAQRLAATGRLAAGIAHEVNNPLGGMLNAVRSLRTRQMTEERREEYLELIEDGLMRIQATVSKILQFTPHKVAPRPTDLGDVIRPTLALARHRIESMGIDVDVTLAEGVVVFGDPYELQQALLNVILNALDAIEEADRERGRLSVRCTAEDGHAHLLVRDDGTGMSEEDRARAFDLFFTTKETGKGSGLGLATAHKIVTDHGGRLELIPRGADGSDGLDVEFVLPLFRE